MTALHRRNMWRRTASYLTLGLITACAGGGMGTPIPHVPGGTTPGATVFDQSTSQCAVSYDGLLWYTVPTGSFSPIDIRHSRCADAALSSSLSPRRPTWSIPRGPTQTRFVGTSLQQSFSVGGMQSIAAVAAPHNVPISWMIGSFMYLFMDKDLYDSYHRSQGDDVESVDKANLVRAIGRALPWYVPTVSAEGAGHERNIAGLMALGEHAFWGITWNSHGTDGTWDYGAPWGSYCADPTSYKRPDPNGECSLLALEWTARDLTRAYISGEEAYFSTDPDDLLDRAGFSTAGAETYIREIADAYAAAGETQPIVMMSQQESGGNTASDSSILNALYDQATVDHMKVETLAQVAPDAMTFSAAPRAVAFPYIPGGVNVPSSIVNGQTLYPATIDYHDTQIGMSFLAGHTLPTRLFPYAKDPESFYNVPLVSLPGSEFPTLTNATVSRGMLYLILQAPIRLHFGIAIWSDPAKLGISQPGAIAAGRAGEVITFDLQSGQNQISIRCPGCTATTFSYST